MFHSIRQSILDRCVIEKRLAREKVHLAEVGQGEPVLPVYHNPKAGPKWPPLSTSNCGVIG